MVVLISKKNEEAPIKNESARVVTALSIDFQMPKVSLLRSRWWGRADIFIQDLMVDLVTCKNEKDPF